MSREKQIYEQAVEEMARDMCDSCREAVTAEECQLNCCDGVRQHAEALYARGYRKQSENMLDIETVKKWLYEMAINNVGCYLEGDFSTACELIISRLDGLKRFAERR